MSRDWTRLSRKVGAYGNLPEVNQGAPKSPLLQTSIPLKPKHQPRTHIGIGTANGGTSLGFNLGAEAVEQFLFLLATIPPNTAGHQAALLPLQLGARLFARRIRLGSGRQGCLSNQTIY